jgi:hypothetical protein
MQIGCELIKKWKGFMPEPLQVLGVVGPLAYWAMRLGNPWINHVPKVLGIQFPKLENYFFVLEPEAS